MDMLRGRNSTTAVGRDFDSTPRVAYFHFDRVFSDHSVHGHLLGAPTELLSRIQRQPDQTERVISLSMLTKECFEEEDQSGDVPPAILVVTSERKVIKAYLFSHRLATN